MHQRAESRRIRACSLLLFHSHLSILLIAPSAYEWAGLFTATKKALVCVERAGSHLIKSWTDALGEEQFRYLSLSLSPSEAAVFPQIQTSVSAVVSKVFRSVMLQRE